VLHGALPRPGYPEKLKKSAAERWRTEARLTLDYARQAHRGHLTETAGAIATAAHQAAHAVLAERAEWVTNEKTLLDRAGLRRVDGILADAHDTAAAIDEAAGLLT
jgi:hypothetical protein